MCTPTNEIQFCTCIDEDLKETKDIYIWTLYRYLGEYKSELRGKILMVIKDFYNGISIQSVTEKLNNGNVFDFDYIPKERDSLHISFNASNRREYNYFKVIYRKGRWQEGGNPFFGSHLEKINGGKIDV